MKTIYYLGDIIGKVWNENDLPQVEIVATTLGREQLTLNNFIGDLLQTIEFYVPTKDTNGDGTPDFEWKVADGTFRQWKSGDPNAGTANTGDLVKFPFILNDDKPTLKIRLTLKIGNAESLPTHVYLDTIILLGTISLNFGSKFSFGLGVIISSFLFFFSFVYKVKALLPAFFVKNINSFKSIVEKFLINPFIISRHLATSYWYSAMSMTVNDLPLNL